MDEPLSIGAKHLTPQAAAHGTPGQSTRCSGKILLAEGHRLNQRIAYRILQTQGYEVTIAVTSEQVLSTRLRSKFDLILIDAGMPDAEATSIIRELETKTGGHIPIVAMTSSAMQQDRCLRAGVDKCISIPLNFGELRAVVASFLSLANVGPAFDEGAALEHVGGDQDFLCTLAAMFVESAPSQTAEIRAGVEQSNSSHLMHAAHKLKGSACALCATALIDATQSLESIGESGDMALAIAEYHRFELEMERLVTALIPLTFRSEDQKDSKLIHNFATAGAISCLA